MLIPPQPYSADWTTRFETYKTALRTAYPSADMRIFHIGSTAVQGLSAKPIIDMQLGVTSLDAFDPAPLSAAGFEFDPAITSDDVPKDDVPANWRKCYARRHEDGVRVAHLHIRQVYKPNFRFALLFRDFLRATPDVADHYGAFKIRAAAVSASTSDPGGSGTYLDLKDPFVAVLGMLAQDWAERSGWAVPVQ